MPRKRPEFHIRTISKGNGRFRVIYEPRKDVKKELKSYVETLEKIALEVCPPNVVHGFWPARNCVSNAIQHIGYEYTLCMDLTDFFDHCHDFTTGNKPGELTAVHVTNLPPYNVICPDGACRQGLPTSPAAANICAAKMDWKLYELAKEHGDVYTRYADDLSFSSNNWDSIKMYMLAADSFAKDHGFQINERKTKTYCARAGRRIITGVAVDDKTWYPTRKAKRMLRSAKHKAKMKPSNPHWAHRAAGLAEWCKVKRPGIGKKARKLIDETPEDALQIASAASLYGVV